MNRGVRRFRLVCAGLAATTLSGLQVGVGEPPTELTHLYERGLILHHQLRCREGRTRSQFIKVMTSIALFIASLSAANAFVIPGTVRPLTVASSVRMSDACVEVGQNPLGKVASTSAHLFSGLRCPAWAAP